MIRLHADFNNCTEDQKVRLHTLASLRDIDQHKRELRSGIRVLLNDGEIEVEARLERDRYDEMWLGVPDWSTLRDL
jgi:hypothetical protein